MINELEPDAEARLLIDTQMFKVQYNILKTQTKQMDNDLEPDAEARSLFDNQKIVMMFGADVSICTYVVTYVLFHLLMQLIDRFTD